MKFTIFTPFYEYIDGADNIYQSLIKQTYVHWEWLICDDFSENPEVLTKLKYLESLDDRIKIIYPEYKNQYLFNLPVKHSSGEIMVIIDSDDTPYPKLLEVYKNILDNFPNVSLLGCSSLMRNGSFSGTTTGAKYINYNGSLNYINSLNNKVYSIIGDARAFRLSKVPKDGIFSNEIFDNFIGVDIQKSLIMEEIGDIMAIPRVLYDYTLREGSMSGPTSLNKNRENNDNIIQKLFEDANRRIDRKKLISINNYFDDSFKVMKNFYFSGIDKDGSSKVIEYWDSNIIDRDKEKLNKLFFDHKIYYNQRLKRPDSIIMCINNESEIDFIDILKNRNLQGVPLTITLDNELKDSIFKKLKQNQYIYWFNIFNYLTIKVFL